MPLTAPYLATARRFEIHCWNEETEQIALALQYGRLKPDDWAYGRIIAGDVTPAFREMVLSLPQPRDGGYENKMTPFCTAPDCTDSTKKTLVGKY